MVTHPLFPVRRLLAIVLCACAWLVSAAAPAADWQADCAAYIAILSGTGGGDDRAAHEKLARASGTASRPGETRLRKEDEP